MYAVIRHYSTDSGSVDEMFRHVSDEFADRVPKQVDAILYTAVHAGDGTALTITVFADEEAHNRSAAAVAGVQQSLGARFGVRETAVHHGPVVVSRASEPLLTPVHAA